MSSNFLKWVLSVSILFIAVSAYPAVSATNGLKTDKPKVTAVTNTDRIPGRVTNQVRVAADLSDQITLPQSIDKTNYTKLPKDTVSNRAAQDIDQKKIKTPISIDLTAGAFFPVFDLGTGMPPAFDLCVSAFVPAASLLPVSFLEFFDLGVSFYMTPGSALSGRNAGIIFLGALFDVYYRVPLRINTFSVYALLGLGITGANAWVANGTTTGSTGSADFTLRPGIGCRWEFFPNWYARLDVSCFMAFEKISATGIPVTIGVGYEF